MNSSKVMNLWIFEEMKMSRSTQDMKYYRPSEMMQEQSGGVESDHKDGLRVGIRLSYVCS